MTDEGRLPPGPRRDFVSAVYRLYELAGKPAARTISLRIRERDDLPGTLSHEGVSAIIRGSGGVPRWENLESLIRVLVQRSVTPLNVDDEINRIHVLWIAADTVPFEALQQNGLAAELRLVAEQYRAHGLTVKISTDDLANEPPADVTAAFVGAIRQSLSNVAQHSGVYEAFVRAATVGEGIEVSVTDSGAGFDPLSTPRGYGIARSIQQRMHALGAEAHILSTPGGGTWVNLKWSPA